MRDRKGATDLDDRLPGFPPRQSLSPLMRGELWLSSEAHPASLSSFPSFASPSPDQLSLELGEAGQHCQHEQHMRRRRTGPGIAK